jgi:spermidine/putrescine ABC transporter ATP-binding subunit
MAERTGSSLNLVELRKAFGKTIAVDGVSLTVEPGEFLTLLGPSGSGKTTTLMTIAGFERPDSGAVRLNGRDITGLAPHQRGIGVVFQNYALFPHMTAFENVAFSLRMRDVARSEIGRRVSETLGLVRLSELEGRYPRQLSGGQQQRVALARALVFEPAVLLLDEPLGALDRLLREHMQLELRRIHQSLGTTMIYVTHDQEEALVLSDRIAIMNNGRITQLGTPQEVYDTPASRFVAGFLGESNFFRGQLLTVNGEAAEVLVGGLKLRVRCGPTLLPNGEVEFTIRPEKIRLGEAEGSDVDTHRGVVEDVIYSGERIKYLVRLSVDLAVVIKQQNRSDVPAFRRAEVVAVSWDLKDARLIRDVS